MITLQYYFNKLLIFFQLPELCTQLAEEDFKTGLWTFFYQNLGILTGVLIMYLISLMEWVSIVRDKKLEIPAILIGGNIFGINFDLTSWNVTENRNNRKNFTQNGKES